eukprot:8668088-Pyramimonas_sp.AAC.1
MPSMTGRGQPPQRETIAIDQALVVPTRSRSESEPFSPERSHGLAKRASPHWVSAGRTDHWTRPRPLRIDP